MSSDHWIEYWDAYKKTQDQLMNAVHTLERIRKMPPIDGERYLLKEDEIMLDFVIITLRQRLSKWAKDYRPVTESEEK